MNNVYPCQLISKNNKFAVIKNEVESYIVNPTLAGSSDETEIKMIVQQAQLFVEKYTGTDMLKKSYKTYADNFLNLEILKRPIEVSKIEILTDSGTETFTDYRVIDNLFYPTIYTNSSPSLKCEPQVVTIEFVAGYIDGYEYSATTRADDNLPDNFRTAILMMTAFLFGNRGDCDMNKIPHALLVILDSLKGCYI